MIEYKVTNQTLMQAGAIQLVGGSLKYITAEFTFSDDWDGITSKWATFTKGDTTYQINLNSGGEITEADNLNLAAGEWRVAVFGTNSDGKKITTNAVRLPVSASGEESGIAPLEVPLSAAEQLDARVTTAEANAAEALSKANDTQNTAAQAAQTAAQQAGIATEQANAASLSKDATDNNKNATDTNVTTVQQYAVIAAEQKSAAESAANRAEAAAASFPMRYYRATVAEMEAITTAKQGDLCYVTDYAAHESTLYTYDTTDVDADEINPEWVPLGYLKFADMTREDLLAVLQLATVATTGSYSDLTDKPNRYESFAVISPADGAVTWDYGITDKVKITLTADTTLTISNVYNGAVGIMEVYGDFALTLPAGSDTAADYDYIELLDGEHWQYMFMYDGTAFHWTRTVCG